VGWGGGERGGGERGGGEREWGGGVIEGSRAPDWVEDAEMAAGGVAAAV
jgi:hypothetical protein